MGRVGGAVGPRPLLGGRPAPLQGGRGGQPLHHPGHDQLLGHLLEANNIRRIRWTRLLIWARTIPWAIQRSRTSLSCLGPNDRPGCPGTSPGPAGSADRIAENLAGLPVVLVVVGLGESDVADDELADRQAVDLAGPPRGVGLRLGPGPFQEDLAAYCLITVPDTRSRAGRGTTSGPPRGRGPGPRICGDDRTAIPCGAASLGAPELEPGRTTAG